MKLLVLVKYSLDVGEIRVDAVTQALRMKGVPSRFGGLERGAVEVAVRIKEADEGVVEVLCFGPPAAHGAVKELLAMGVDEATVIEDPYGGSADASVAVRVLEAGIRKRGPFDLIICGFASDDGYSHQTGPRLSERLGIPFISYVREMKIKDGLLIARRDLEEGHQTISVPLPVIVSIAEEAYVARGVTLLQAMKAQKKPTNAWTLDRDLGLARDELGQMFKGSMLGQTGVVSHRKQEVLLGFGLEAMADLFIDRLVADEILALRVEK